MCALLSGAPEFNPKAFGVNRSGYLVSLIVIFGFSVAVSAETIRTTVNRMVCAFCATGIERTFRKQPEVDWVKVDLAEKLVTVRTKPGKTLSDAKVKEIVTYSGYKMGKIVREK